MRMSCYSFYNYEAGRVYQTIARKSFQFVIGTPCRRKNQLCFMKTQVNFIKTQVDFIKNQDCHVQTLETRYLAYKLFILAFTRFCLALYASVSKSLLARFYRNHLQIRKIKNPIQSHLKQNDSLNCNLIISTQFNHSIFISQIMTIHKSKLSYIITYNNVTTKLISISYLIFQDCHSKQPPQTTQVSSALELTLLSL
ncbi:Hypothetical_protein [Hexamita inflata]|uniref:Hypothetical_protein n=1 Tax=Hexamita inflata TaxID=28002 RepID=A0AA86UZC4_9EUKA|nr:Hypothetical protein HINF_LOCUS65865 [Hexamita inflata]